MNDSNSIIQVKTTNFKTLFEQNNTIRYEVPFFQRGYVWDRKQWNTLRDNINTEVFGGDIDNITLDAIRENKLFFGTIVLKQNIQNTQNSPMLKYDIIDGQQRLITSYILCIKLYQQLINLENKYQEAHDSSDQFRDTLCNKDDNENNYNQLKIVSAQGDTLSIYKLLYGEINPALPNDILSREQNLRREKDKISNLYSYCGKYIFKSANREILLKWMQAILESLQLVCIYLPDNFDEQIIFETLNAEGVELTTSELLCNYIFRTIDKPQQNKNTLHYTQWLIPQRELERIRQSAGNTEDYSNFESYLRYLISINKEKMLPKGKPMYYRFKEKYTSSEDALNQLDTICSRIEYFKDYIKQDRRELFSKTIQYRLADIVNIGIHSIIPFIIELLHAIEKEDYSPNNGEQVLSIIITMLARNKVLGSYPKYDTFFPNLFQRMKRESDTPLKALENIIKKSGFYIADDRFTEAITNNRLYYEKDKKFPYYFLQKINRAMSDYNQDIDYSSFTQIEHVLPQKDKQTLNTEWWGELGDDIEDEYFDTLKHSLGNLTIIGTGNQAVSDRFITDKIVHKAYDNPRPKLTQSVIDSYKKDHRWNLKTIRDRSATLAEIACKVWSWEIDN